LRVTSRGLGDVYKRQVMGCNCGKKKPVVVTPQPTPTPIPVDDAFNNLDDYHLIQD
jgi:hypothetical protein